jgi:hypothetical protein
MNYIRKGILMQDTFGTSYKCYNIVTHSNRHVELWNKKSGKKKMSIQHLLAWFHIRYSKNCTHRHEMKLIRVKISYRSTAVGVSLSNLQALIFSITKN